MANEIARSLRKRMTPQEVKLWVHLRSWRKQGFHFRRQAPRDDYVLDFVCLKHRLIVEVDGGQHNFGGHARRDVEAAPSPTRPRFARPPSPFGGGIHTECVALLCVNNEEGSNVARAVARAGRPGLAWSRNGP